MFLGIYVWTPSTQESLRVWYFCLVGLSVFLVSIFTRNGEQDRQTIRVFRKI
jgi:hypothetical protein